MNHIRTPIIANRSSVSTIIFPRLRRPGRELTVSLPLERFAGLVQHGTTPTRLEYPISAKTGETLERELQRDLSPGTPETRTNRSGSRSSVLPFSREKHASRSSALLPRCMDGHQKDTKTNTPRAVDLNNRAHARRLHARSPLETCSMWLTLERFTHEKL